MNIRGQETAITYLKNGLQSNRLSPSLLFVGPEGVGKRLTALELTKSFLCQKKASLKNPDWGGCQECDGCRRSDKAGHPDLFYLNRGFQAALLREKPETQTGIKIESIRQIDKFLHIKPWEGKKRIAIVDEADKMTMEAAHSFLKLLEEPPHNSLIVLLSLNEHNLPVTIRSRCARLSFRSISTSLLTSWLSEKFGLEEEEARQTADLSGGSFSKAVELRENPDDSFDLTGLTLDELFETLNDRRWRREGREQSRKMIDYLIESSRKNLGEGRDATVKRIHLLLSARRQIERHVTPKLVLESLYLSLVSLQ